MEQLRQDPVRRTERSHRARELLLDLHLRLALHMQPRRIAHFLVRVALERLQEHLWHIRAAEEAAQGRSGDLQAETGVLQEQEGEDWVGGKLIEVPRRQLQQQIGRGIGIASHARAQASPHQGAQTLRWRLRIFRLRS